MTRNADKVFPLTHTTELRSIFSVNLNNGHKVEIYNTNDITALVCDGSEREVDCQALISSLNQAWRASAITSVTTV
jgi:predicted transcriptional regulator